MSCKAWHDLLRPAVYSILRSMARRGARGSASNREKSEDDREGGGVERRPSLEYRGYAVTSDPSEVFLPCTEYLFMPRSACVWSPSLILIKLLTLPARLLWWAELLQSYCIRIYTCWPKAKRQSEVHRSSLARVSRWRNLEDEGEAENAVLRVCVRV